MRQLPLKLRHYTKVKELIKHTDHDVSRAAMEKRANSVFFLDKNIDEFPKKPSLVGSAEGKIKKIMFAVPGIISPEKGRPILDIFFDLLTKLPEHTELVLLLTKSSTEVFQDFLHEKSLSKRTEIILIPEHIKYSVWAEDPYIIAKDEETGDNYFIEPHSFPRWEDGFLAYFASKSMGWKRVRYPLYFEGGNILIGDDFLLVGADYPLTTLNYIEKSFDRSHTQTPVELVKKTYSKFLDYKRKILFAGSLLPVPSAKEKDFYMNGEKWSEIFFQNNEGGTIQPLFHIDMFITLAGRASNGKYQVLVGDPDLALDLLELDFKEYAIPELFHDVAEGLANQGFEVHRLPLPVVYIDDPENKQRMWYFTSYNNCLVEIDAENKTVWLPTYGYGEWEVLKRTDEQAKQIFEGLGFKVFLLTDYHPLAEDSGSLHCIKKYLDRE
jgi:hypothetical protein